MDFLEQYNTALCNLDNANLARLDLINRSTIKITAISDWNSVISCFRKHCDDMLGEYFDDILCVLQGLKSFAPTMLEKYNSCILRLPPGNTIQIQISSHKNKHLLCCLATIQRINLRTHIKDIPDKINELLKTELEIYYPTRQLPFVQICCTGTVKLNNKSRVETITNTTGTMELNLDQKDDKNLSNQRTIDILDQILNSIISEEFTGILKKNPHFMGNFRISIRGMKLSGFSIYTRVGIRDNKSNSVECNSTVNGENKNFRPKPAHFCQLVAQHNSIISKLSALNCFSSFSGSNVFSSFSGYD